MLIILTSVHFNISFCVIHFPLHCYKYSLSIAYTSISHLVPILKSFPHDVTLLRCKDYNVILWFPWNLGIVARLCYGGDERVKRTGLEYERWECRTMHLKGLLFVEVKIRCFPLVALVSLVSRTAVQEWTLELVEVALFGRDRQGDVWGNKDVIIIHVVSYAGLSMPSTRISIFFFTVSMYLIISFL